MKRILFNVAFLLIVVFLYAYVTIRIFQWGAEEGYKRAKAEFSEPTVFVEKR